MTSAAQQRFYARDGRRLLTFEGRLVAQSDSQSGEDVRWTELALYQTTRDKYILEKIGRSDVFHSDMCARVNKGKQFDSLEVAMASEEDQEDELKEFSAERYVPCEECRPSTDDAPVWVERDIFQTYEYTNAEELIRALYRRDSNDNPVFLSRTARTLLDEAVENDHAIATVMRTPAEVT